MPRCEPAGIRLAIPWSSAAAPQGPNEPVSSRGNLGAQNSVSAFSIGNTSTGSGAISVGSVPRRWGIWMTLLS